MEPKCTIIVYQLCTAGGFRIGATTDQNISEHGLTCDLSPQIWNGMVDNLRPTHSPGDQWQRDKSECVK